MRHFGEICVANGGVLQMGVSMVRYVDRVKDVVVVVVLFNV